MITVTKKYYRMDVLPNQNSSTTRLELLVAILGIKYIVADIYENVTFYQIFVDNEGAVKAYCQTFYFHDIWATLLQTSKCQILKSAMSLRIISALEMNILTGYAKKCFDLILEKEPWSWQVFLSYTPPIAMHLYFKCGKHHSRTNKLQQCMFKELNILKQIRYHSLTLKTHWGLQKHVKDSKYQLITI